MSVPKVLYISPLTHFDASVHAGKSQWVSAYLSSLHLLLLPYTQRLINAKEEYGSTSDFGKHLPRFISLLITRYTKISAELTEEKKSNCNSIKTSNSSKLLQMLIDFTCNTI